MARKTKQHIAASSELGNGDFGISYNTKTGRPIRKSARKTESPFVDSAVYVSDAEEDDAEADHDVTSDDEGIAVVRLRKRKRSPSPPMSEASLSSREDLSDDDRAVAFSSPMRRSNNFAQMPSLQVTLNVPAGPERQVVLKINVGSLLAQQPSTSQTPTKPAPRSTRKRTSLPTSLVSRASRRKVTSSTPASSSHQHAGFLDLPPELRNQIYRLAFCAPGRLDFGAPSPHFQRSSAFLRTCKQVHEEGRSILYSENEFFFQRQSRRHGSIWAADWGELGFKPVRKFLKQIGPSNTQFIRHITFLFEDAAPSLNPNLHNAEERRFVHDDNLQSIIRHLSVHAKLEKFHLNFQGRKTLDVYYPNDHFLDLLTRVRADEVEFVKHPIWGSHTSYHSRSKQSASVQSMCLSTMVRKKKMFANL